MWPVVLFMPWLLLGFAYLLESLRKPSHGSSQTY